VADPLNSLFCRHNRFTADCPICSKGTLLDSSQKQSSRPRTPSARRVSEPSNRSARVVQGPYASAGPYEREGGTRYEVRLEKVPGGVRLAQWSGGSIEKAAPVLAAEDLPRMLATTRERSLLPERDQDALDGALSPGEPAGVGISAGRSGDFRDELRAEVGDDGMLRIARWLYRPNQGWELQEAPVMLPAKRLAEALGKLETGAPASPSSSALGSASSALSASARAPGSARRRRRACSARAAAAGPSAPRDRCETSCRARRPSCLA
jgi:hypothetical protein